MIDSTAYIAELCRLYVLVTLAAALAGKVTDMADFETAIAGLAGLTRGMARVAACVVMAAEASIAGLLLAGERWTRVGMGAAVLMFLVFTGIILAALVGRKAVRCNCFGGGGHRISAYDVVRNGLMIAAALFAMFHSAPTVPAASEVAVLLLGMALILFLVSTSLPKIIAVAMPRPSA